MEIQREYAVSDVYGAMPGAWDNYNLKVAKRKVRFAYSDVNHVAHNVSFNSKGRMW